jgi:hypothetical protein
MASDELVNRLQAVLVRHMGEPGTMHNLQRLTGGANRTTLSFDAEVRGQLLALIVQLGAEVSDPVAGVTPEVNTADQARLMIAAQRAGAPAPKVLAILEPADQLGQGYIVERVEGKRWGRELFAMNGLPPPAK